MSAGMSYYKDRMYDPLSFKGTTKSEVFLEVEKLIIFPKNSIEYSSLESVFDIMSYI